MIDKQELLQALQDPEIVRQLHIYSDLDKGRRNQHHTLGRGVNQASPGDHNHDGKNTTKLSSVKTISVTWANGTNVATVSHGLKSTPGAVVVTLQSASTTSRWITVNNVTATTVDLQLFNTAGAVTAGPNTHTVHMIALP